MGDIHPKIEEVVTYVSVFDNTGITICPLFINSSKLRFSYTVLKSLSTSLNHYFVFNSPS